MRAPLYLGTLAEAHLTNGSNAAAAEAVESALALQVRSKELWCRPELLRVQAKIAARRGDREQARAILGRARKAAISTGARSLELRTARDVAEMAGTDPGQTSRVNVTGSLGAH